ncbi:MAG: TonB-dependent receptor, partial [Candidatus Cloacimonadota bacterium]|nr:TonB-dependent receptor [Candidatus Cloacimonadota bacterium]
AGKVKDQDGNPVPYIAVRIKGTDMGALTDEKGRYFLINIPPGTYTIACTPMGYHEKFIEGVIVRVDATTTQKIDLVSSALELLIDVTVKADVDLIVASETGSSKTMTSDDIEDMTAESIDDIVAMSAGVSNVNGEPHFRGGRANEVVYSIDGMSVSDPVDGGVALSVDMDAVKDMKVMTGGFTAEYGNAQSAVVNIVTKSGSENYEGKLEFATDHLFDDGYNKDEMKFAIGGPVFGHLFGDLRKNFTFFLNGGGLWSDGRYGKYYESDPNDDLLIPSATDFTPYDNYSDRDEIAGFDITRNYNTLNMNLKMKYKFDPTKNITIGIRGDERVNEPYYHRWKYAMEHYAQTEANMRQYMFTYDQLFNSKTNLKIKASYYQKNSISNPKGVDRDDYFVLDTLLYDPYNVDYANGVWALDANEDGVFDNYGLFENYSPADFWTYSIQGQVDNSSVFGYVAPGTIYAGNVDDETSILDIKGDFEYQYNMVHGFKTGVEIIKHHIVKDQWSSPWVVDTGRYQRYLADYGTVVDTLENGTEYYSAQTYYDATIAASGSKEGYEANPYQGAFYIQDQMEWEDLNVNLGIRSDVWYLGSNYNITQLDGSYKQKEFAKEDRFQIMISPRLGISHSISERDQLRFAYNYQNQLPEFKYVFTTADTIDAITQSGITVGEPNLEPKITITYEVGLNHIFTDEITFDVTAYYKNTYNYVSSMKIDSATDDAVSWYKYISENYGSAKGIDLNLSRSLANFVRGGLSYSLAWANGNSSGVNSVQDENTNLREFALDWDIRHNVSFSSAFVIKNNEEFLVPFTDFILPFDDFTTSFSYSLSSGEAYTPQTEASGSPLDTNSARMDYTSDASLKITKKFTFKDRYSLRAYLNISNLFDTENVLFVYGRTGEPYETGVDLSEQGTDYVPQETAYMYDQYIRDPANISAGRRINAGISFNW